MSKSSFRGNTTCGSTFVPAETSREMMLSLWTIQVGLHSYNNFNLILEKEEGDFYTITKTFDELIPYLKKYYEKGYINTGGRNIDKYIQRVLKNYIKDYPNRPAYLIYVNAKGKFNKGENKIMGVSDEELEMVLSKAKEVQADAIVREVVAETDPMKAMLMLLRSLTKK
jgi:hypothetical protein